MPNDIGKLLIYLGSVLVVLGILFHFGEKFLPLGRLPGDIHWEGTHGSFHFPVVSCIIVSIILSLIVHFLVSEAVSSFSSS